ncbi:MAG: hypothetical protein ACOCVZ_07350 [Gemmatimonadota bacterium]
MDVSTIPSYGALLAVKYASRALYDIREEWVGEVPRDPWDRVRLIAVLHHTSLAEGVYLPVVPNRVLRNMARHAVLPIAQETMDRPLEGRVFKLLIPNVVPITRRRDESWTRVLSQIDDPHSMVALFPEGRMMRPDGRDKKGQPMTIKPGIAEVLRSMGSGRMVLGYSGGLHHVFRPGASRPRFFKSLHIRLESLDIAEYVAARMEEDGTFPEAVVRDLTRRRDLHTPIAPGTPAAVSAEVVRRRNRCRIGARRHRLDSGPDRSNGARTDRAPAETRVEG